ncbi:Heat shock protein 15 [Wohlfahrtiimonas chitiniclastica SH04]|uniref:Heat shock protein 15 n=1 Tax=Wohlfahrtiimonas chitiniclastica SH04 TaxID=1261130 RepID=L8XUM5_9GAMM|nr:S4 domain-containing protein [Wohlfahrtiimonas chitiniclastica]ELV07607.1 Heat shock protein 15 [Wohlfahrtiimonas chitiniclastica SH04]
MRLDKWLWAARFYKTRRLAVEAIEKHQVSVNGDKAKPARMIKIGDTLVIDKAGETFVIIIDDLSEVRGPAPKAQLLYHETEESLAKRLADREMRKLVHTPKPDKAPDKKDRQLLRNMRHSYE